MGHFAPYLLVKNSEEYQNDRPITRKKNIISYYSNHNYNVY